MRGGGCFVESTTSHGYLSDGHDPCNVDLLDCQDAGDGVRCFCSLRRRRIRWRFCGRGRDGCQCKGGKGRDHQCLGVHVVSPWPRAEETQSWSGDLLSGRGSNKSTPVWGNRPRVAAQDAYAASRVGRICGAWSCRRSPKRCHRGASGRSGGLVTSAKRESLLRASWQWHGSQSRGVDPSSSCPGSAAGFSTCSVSAGSRRGVAWYT